MATSLQTKPFTTNWEHKNMKTHIMPFETDKGKLILKFQKSIRIRTGSTILKRWVHVIKFLKIIFLLMEANNLRRTKRQMISWKPIICWWIWLNKIYQSLIWMPGVNLIKMARCRTFSNLRRKELPRRLGQHFFLLIDSRYSPPLNNLMTHFRSQFSINM